MSFAHFGVANMSHPKRMPEVFFVRGELLLISFVFCELFIAKRPCNHGFLPPSTDSTKIGPRKVDGR